MKYIGSSPERVLLELGGLTYYAKQNEVDLVPTELVTGSDLLQSRFGRCVVSLPIQ